MIKVIGPKDSPPPNAVVVNTTSRSKEDWSKGLSPFFLGPVYLYGGQFAKNVENAWQYAKVYPSQLDSQGEPTKAYFAWATNGWNSTQAVRYPMGKGVKASFSLWENRKLDYVTARKQIYIPLYSRAVKYTDAFRSLSALAAIEDDLYLWDFDGYNHRALGMSYQDVIDCPTMKMGHAFVLAMMLEGFLKV